MQNIKIIVPGGLNTDIIWMWVPEIVWKWELSFWGDIQIWPWWKSRNLAQMIAILKWKNVVAMIGKTSKDPFGLWKIPYDALKENFVNTDFIKVLDFETTKKFPWIALIPVDKNWNNQIYVLPWINEDFSKKDIDDSNSLFKNVWKNNGILALTLELSLETWIYSIKKASEFWLKVILDPGGVIKWKDYSKLLNEKIFLIKPNEFEAEVLSWVKVTDFETAKKSAKFFLEKWIKNVLITLWKKWAYFFSENEELKFDIPKDISWNEFDETGCWDQTMATLVAFISDWMEIKKAIKLAIISWTLQFYRKWISPVKMEELEKFI